MLFQSCIFNKSFTNAINDVNFKSIVHYTNVLTFCSMIQIIYHPDPQLFTINDGFQEPITIKSAHRNILGATFHKFMLKNIGGSEKFAEKQKFFYSELKQHHHQQDASNRSRRTITVSRFNLVETVRVTFAAAIFRLKYLLFTAGYSGYKKFFFS